MPMTLLRTVLIYALLLLAMRLLGKRQLGELELSELVVTVLVADIAVRPIVEENAPFFSSLAPLAVLFGSEYLISLMSLRSAKLRTLLFGKPSILISHGKIDQGEMKRNRFTIDELMQELRNQGVQDIQSVDYAVLETSGALNLLLKVSEQPLTPSQLGLTLPEPGYATILINDGRTLSGNLRHVGKDERWLQKVLKEQGIRRAQDVYYLQINDAGDVTLQEKD